jgi:hypothetical protein
MLTDNSVISPFFTNGTTSDCTIDTMLSWEPDTSGTYGVYLQYVNDAWAWGLERATSQTSVEDWLEANGFTLITPEMLNQHEVAPFDGGNIYLNPGEYLQFVVRVHNDYSYTEQLDAPDDGHSALIQLAVEYETEMSINTPLVPWPATGVNDLSRLRWMPSRSTLFNFDTISGVWKCHKSSGSIPAIDDNFIAALKQAYLRTGLIETLSVIWTPCYKGTTPAIINTGTQVNLLGVEFADGSVEYVTWTSNGNYVIGNLVFAISTGNSYVANHTVDVWSRTDGTSTDFTYITSINIPETTAQSAVAYPGRLPRAWGIVDWNDGTRQTPFNDKQLLYLSNMYRENDYFGVDFVSPLGNCVNYALLPMYYRVEYLQNVVSPYKFDDHMLNVPEDGYVNFVQRLNERTTVFDDVSGVYTTHWKAQYPMDVKLLGYERATTVQGYRVVRPLTIVGDQIRATKLRTGTVDSVTLLASLSYDFVVSEFANGYIPRIRYELSINDEVVSGDAYEDVNSIGINEAVNSALGLVDVFNADEIADTVITNKLRELINSRYNSLDPYMQMYADLTANYIVSEVLNALVNSIMTNDIMPTVYGVSDTTKLRFNNVYEYSAYELRTLEDDLILQDIMDILGVSTAAMDYRLQLFNYAHEAFNNIQDVSLTGTLDRIKSDIAMIYTELQSALTSTGKTSKALLLNAAYQETILTKVSDVLLAAASAGAETMRDAISWISRTFSNSEYSYVLPDKQKRLYQSIIDNSVYAGYEANIMKDTIAYNSDVDYWSSYFTRKGAAVALPSGVEPEFRTAADGAQYLWPPIISSVVRTTSFDTYIDNGGYFYVPLAATYIIVKRLSGSVYELDWCARFNGGSDADLLSAMNGVLEEFYDVGWHLAEAYLNRDDFAFQVLGIKSQVQTEIPSGFEISTLIGSLSSVGLNTLSGFLATGNPYGALISGGVTAIAAVAQTALADENAIANTNFSATALVNANEAILDSIELADAGVLNSRGRDCVNTVNALLLWAIKYGFIAPVMAYHAMNIHPVGHGVYAPSLVPPKYYYVGESQDYSGWMISLGIVVSAYALHWRRTTQAVRMRTFIPGELATAISAAAGWLYNGFTSVVSEVNALRQANALGWDVETDPEGQPITLGYIANLLQALTGDVGSIASVASAIQGTVDTTEGDVKKIIRMLNSTKPVTRY